MRFAERIRSPSRSMKFSNLLFQIEFEDFTEMMEDLGLPISYHWAAPHPPPPQLIKCQHFSFGFTGQSIT